MNAQSPFDLTSIRAQFPALARKIKGKDLVYLDSAASAHKPQAVLDAMTGLYSDRYANVHRGVHTLSQEATDAFESGRKQVATFMNAHEDEVVFTSGTSESINLIAQSWARTHVGPGDAIVVSEIEHHSNLIPWQLVCAQTGAELRVARVDDRGVLDLEHVARLLQGAKLLAVGHISNALGTIHPVKQLTQMAHQAGALIAIDGAQGAVHASLDMKALDCDFYSFSAHKVYGPTGMGVLYGKRALLDAMPPWQGGGEMIDTVDLVKGSTWAAPPARFEAGTPHIAGAVGMGAGCSWLAQYQGPAFQQQEKALLTYAREALGAIHGLTIVGTAPDAAGLVGFTIEGVHPHDLGTILDHQGIAVRTGHHCAQPAMKRMGVTATTRASFGIYTTTAEIDKLVMGIDKAKRMLL